MCKLFVSRSRASTLLVAVTVAASVTLLACASEDPEPILDTEDAPADTADASDGSTDLAPSDVPTELDATDAADADQAELDVAEEWTCGPEYAQYHQPAHDDDCAGNVGCGSASSDEPCECRCDWCDNERCVGVVCDGEGCFPVEDTSP